MKIFSYKKILIFQFFFFSANIQTPKFDKETPTEKMKLNIFFAILLVILTIAIQFSLADMAEDAGKAAVNAYNQRLDQDAALKRLEEVVNLTNKNGIINLTIKMVDTSCVKKSSSDAESCAVSPNKNEKICANVLVTHRPGGEQPFRVTSLGSCKRNAS